MFSFIDSIFSLITHENNRDNEEPPPTNNSVHIDLVYLTKSLSSSCNTNILNTFDT
jgi:hypothetical protein